MHVLSGGEGAGRPVDLALNEESGARTFGACGLLVGQWGWAAVDLVVSLPPERRRAGRSGEFLWTWAVGHRGAGPKKTA